ncbi:MAG TPA: hypothetical protein DCO79_08245 [Spirochaeta sp.]|nr:hypothetical protein [Spirochaeta sp.]
MKYKNEEIYLECLKQLIGSDGREALGGVSIDKAVPGTLSEITAAFLKSAAEGKADLSLLPESDIIGRYFTDIEKSFLEYYSDDKITESISEQASIIFSSDSPVDRARAVSELWSPELMLDDDEIFNSWKLTDVKENPSPYRPEEVIIQLNALYSPAENTAPEEIDEETANIYNAYMKSNPERIAVYDHPVAVFTRGKDHELEKCLVEMDRDIAFEKSAGVYPDSEKLKVLVSISTTHRGLDAVCEKWLQKLVEVLKLKHIQCFLLSENKARELDKIIGPAASIFTVQGKYACHFGALKYAQLLFEKAYGIRAGFKLDTDEGIHSKDMKRSSGKTWLQQLCHPFWGGTALNCSNENIGLGFNIGEYVDSRDLDALGYAEAVRTPEVKPKDDVRGSYLIFNKGVCQAKGTMLLNRAKKLEDFISHPLVKGGGYGIDNAALRAAVPVGFSMVGRAEDQQFYFSAINSGVQGIFNPLLGIIHYKEDVAKSEHQNMAGRNIADIYRMLLFRNLMSYLNVIEKTRPFPANYASEFSHTQSLLLWLYLIFVESAAGNEDAAQEYLREGIKELLPLLDDIKTGKVIRRFEGERAAWTDFIAAVDGISDIDARAWLESLKI